MEFARELFCARAKSVSVSPVAKGEECGRRTYEETWGRRGGCLFVRFWVADRVAKTRNEPGPYNEADEVDDCCVALPIRPPFF